MEEKNKKIAQQFAQNEQEFQKEIAEDMAGLQRRDLPVKNETEEQKAPNKPNQPFVPDKYDAL